MENAILPVKPGTVSNSDKRRLSSIGIVVIEHPEPHTLRIIKPTSEVDASGMLVCAMKALRHSTGISAQNQREQFTILLGQSIDSALAADKKEPS